MPKTIATKPGEPKAATTKKTTKVAPVVLTAAELEKDDCQPVAPYRHPVKAMTVACHRAGTAYTATGIEVGPAHEQAAKAAAEAQTKRKQERAGK
jgi:hypothetical protein